jgi:hypothetical protein
MAALNECNYLLLDLFDGPAECGTHPVEANGLEWLEVKHYCSIANEVRQVVNVWIQVNIHIMTCLGKEILIRGMNVGIYGTKHTEYLSRSSRTFLKSLERYDWIKSRTYGSCSMYAEKIALPVRDLIADRDMLARAHRVPYIAMSPGAIS